MSLALIAGEGALPGLLCARAEAAGDPPLVCVMDGVAARVPAHLPRREFRLERLGSFLAGLREDGVGRICMAGAMRRPAVDPAAVDGASAVLVPRLIEAMARGDDGTLREIVAIMEEAGLRVVGAEALAPDLLPEAGMLTGGGHDAALEAAARVGDQVLAEMGEADSGQACVVTPGGEVAREGADGTDAMLAALRAPGAVLFKAPKPGQERRVDLPVIGPETVAGAAAAGLAAIVIEAGGVLVLEREEVLARARAAGIALWVRAAAPGAEGGR
ncbi:LpxI family protein [Histidinibacterium lentulum]|uniref:LpxI family protein n=1 Tax=Histidinibacterium lentulum TaxID=2480588 RepID=A0A3N2QL28_9RHOB|nr:UDP-2,3-diacylglucosamine diphosphatase LpxI [Histidinibacterium lentulum]ROT95898.1 LpxI family protein [Histidinibacterium lentulum]